MHRHHALSLLALLFLGADLAAAEPIPVQVTGRALVVNGTAELSPGLFGVHYCHIPAERWAEIGITGLRLIHNGMPEPVVKPGTSAPGGVPHVVACFFDRYRPAHILTEPKTWKQSLQELGRRYGAAIADLGADAHIEFWNEPYLNWATKPGVNLDARYYDTADAVEGGPVRIRGMSEPTELLTWRRGKYWVPDDPATTKLHETYVAVGNTFSRIQRLQPGETWEYRGKMHRVIEAWVPWDTSWEARPESQRWYSGRQFGIWYEQMLRAFGEGLRETAPHARYIAGWGFHLHQGDGQRSWVPWETLFKPMIDSGIDLIDGIHEHHYGGDTRVVAAGYETVNAYSTVVHGKPLLCYNTEAGANFDPQRPDAQRSGTERWFARFGSPQRQKAMMAYHYLVRDIVYLASLLPDKAQARAAHASHHTDGGDELGFRQLRHLRGTLMECTGGSDEIWVAATRPQAEQISVVVWNDATEPRAVALTVSPPPGWRLGAGVAERITVPEEGAPILEAEVIDAAVTDAAQTLTLPPRQAVALTYGLERTAAAELAPIRRDQRHGDRILVEVPAGTTQTLTVALAEDLRQGATRAFVQAVVTSNQVGEVGLTVGEHVVTLPRGQWILRAEIPLSALTAQTPLQFTAAERGFAVWSAAILIDREAGPAN